MYLVEFNAAKVVVYSDPRAFDQRVRTWLMIREAENSYFLGHLSQMLAKSGFVAQLWTLEEAATLHAAGVLFSNGTFCMTWATHEQVLKIVEAAVLNQWPIHAVFGPGHVAWWFAQAYAQRTGQKAERGRSERVYQLTRHQFVLPAQGHLEVATPADRTFLREWLDGFMAETAFEMENPDLDGLLNTLIASRSLYLWKSPEPVAMAAWVAPTPNGASVNFVYTPPEFRGQGYGKAVSAALGSQMLASGLRYCFILTDIHDVRSNAVYQAIGAQTVAEFMRAGIVPRHQPLRPAAESARTSAV